MNCKSSCWLSLLSSNLIMWSIISAQTAPHARHGDESHWGLTARCSHIYVCGPNRLHAKKGGISVVFHSNLENYKIISTTTKFHLIVLIAQIWSLNKNKFWESFEVVNTYSVHTQMWLNPFRRLSSIIKLCFILYSCGFVFKVFMPQWPELIQSFKQYLSTLEQSHLSMCKWGVIFTKIWVDRKFQKGAFERI